MYLNADTWTRSERLQVRAGPSALIGVVKQVVESKGVDHMTATAMSQSLSNCKLMVTQI